MRHTTDVPSGGTSTRIGAHIGRVALGAALLLLAACGNDGDGAWDVAVGDKPAVDVHLDHAAIASGAASLGDVLDHGRTLFDAPFNTLDGAGRPESTGTGDARARREFPDNFNRVSGPDANACVGCHNQPRSGGGGEGVANVFVMAQRFPFVDFDGGPGDGNEEHTLETVGNERNTPGMWGSGYVELLAREMTADLRGVRDDAVAAARVAGSDVTLPLVTKGVSFGAITARPDGSVDASAVEGVDADLVVRPFHQKGAVVSLRVFTNNAMNHHHGMQSAERFGDAQDPDADGRADELTDGDVTAATLFQALLPVPGRVMPPDGAGQAAVAEGERLFSAIGCAACHVPALRLESPVFTEPSPWNPAGNLRPTDGLGVVAVDLSAVGPTPRLPPQGDGAVLVPLFSDLKRHEMGPALDNETLVQAGVPTSQWLTKKLWGFASEPPFLHHGRATTIEDAVLAHGGEGQASRDAYAALSAADRAAVLEFLETLRVLPEGATSLVTTASEAAVVGETGAITSHVDQADVDGGTATLEDLLEVGRRLFVANCNALDGAGRPTTTGAGDPRLPRVGTESANRLSGPDAGSCAGCHNLPGPGGGGDNVANVFVLAQRLPFVDFEDPPGEGDGFQEATLRTVGNERNTPGMWGSGYVEMLAREMTADLHAVRDAAIAAAASDGADVTRPLATKGVSFGRVTAHPDGTLDASAVEGVDADLVVRPWHQKGAVVSLRVFTNNAMNHHHGMQSAERFGGGVDPDDDGYLGELTPGDVTALTLFQAALPAPGRQVPADPVRRRAAERGEAVFSGIGCAVCHVPALRLEDPTYLEPSPYNPPGNLRPSDVPAPFAFDLVTEGLPPRLPREPDGSVLVPLFSDLKRHDMGPALDNEALVQAGIPTSHWLTRRLWGFASEPPFLHHGRATLVSEAILAHGGEAQASRDRYAALTEADRQAVQEFLLSLRVLPE